jgi:Tryptophan-associated transmembrane protein (Trp_oprn_chp)
MTTSSRSRLIALVLILVGAGIVWFNVSDNVRSGTRGIALVALAAGGALLATKGRVRRAVACAVVLAGLGLTLGGNAMAILSGLFVIAGGVLAAVASPAWPVMGVRFERRVASEDVDLWAALDRGEDPTGGEESEMSRLRPATRDTSPPARSEESEMSRLRPATRDTSPPTATPRR